MLILVLLRVNYSSVNKNINITKRINVDIACFLIFDLSVSNGNSMNDTKNKNITIVVAMLRNKLIMILNLLCHLVQ